jgi:hypothetical protein
MAGFTEYRTGEKNLEVADRIAEALRLRRDGHTFVVIAEKLGVSTTTAFNYVMQGLRRTMQKPADEMRQEEGEKLKDLWGAWYPKAMGGDARACALCVRISAAYCRLFGLDAPTRIDLTSNSQPIDPSLQVTLAAFGELPPEKQQAVIQAQLKGMLLQRPDLDKEEIHPPDEAAPLIVPAPAEHNGHWEEGR